MPAPHLGICVDGGDVPEFGTGHVVRTLLLATRLRRDYGFRVTYLMRRDARGMAFVRRAGFAVEALADGRPQTMRAAVAARGLDLVLFDRLAVPYPAVRAVQRAGVPAVTFDNLTVGRDPADVAINVLRPTGRSPYEGGAFILLAPHRRPPRRNRARGRRIFLSFGGYDHQRLALRAARALTALDGSFHLHFFLGGNHPDEEEIRGVLGAGSARFRITRFSREFYRTLAASDLAVTAGGVTFTEALCAGVPTIVLAQYDHQAEMARPFARRGAVRLLGFGSDVTEATLRRSVLRLAGSRAARERLSRRARELVDGQGVARMVRLLAAVERLAPGVGGVTLFALTDRTIDFALSEARRRKLPELFAVCAKADAATRRVLEGRAFSVRNSVPRRRTVARWVERMRERHGTAVLIWARWA